MIRWPFALSFLLFFAVSTAQAGINEGDSIPVNMSEILPLFFVGLVMAPIGFVLARLGYMFAFKAVAVLFGLCLVAMVIGAGLFMGDLIMILVVFAAIVIVPAFVYYLLGAWLGWAMRLRKEGTNL